MVQKTSKSKKLAVPSKKIAKSIKKTARPEPEERAYPDEEQGILPDERSEDIEQDLKKGEKTADVYSEEGREALEGEEEIEPWEEGFMEGASGLGQLSKDALTGEPLKGEENIFELEYEGKLYRFLNEKNAKKFLAKKKKEKRL